MTEPGEDPTVFECDGVEVRRAPSALAQVARVIVGIAALASLAEALAWRSWIGALIGGSLVAYGAIVRARQRARGPGRRLRIDETALRIGRRTFTRTALADASIVLDDDLVPILRLEIGRNERRKVELAMPNLAAARDALSTLGFDATRMASRFEVLGAPLGAWELGWLRSFAVLFAVLVVLAGAKAFLPRLGLGLSQRWFEALALFAASSAWLMAVAPLFVRRRLTIGADGVHVAWRPRSRFAQAASIRDARVVEEEVAMGLQAIVLRLYVREGEPLDVVVGVKPRGLSLAHARALAATAQERIERVRADEPTAERAEAPALLLRRPAGSLDAWLAALRQQLRRPDTFREDVGELSRRLWSVAEDPRGAPADRAAAAIALGPTVDGTGRERLEALGPKTAIPALRAAFEAAAEGDERAMRRAMGALEAEGDGRSDDADDAEPPKTGDAASQRRV
jgi:hypothetical protein